MASVLAMLDDKAFKKHAKQFAPGAVLPIDSFQTEDRSFATKLSHGGALYLAVADAAGTLWLVAVLEAPETSGIKKGDRRKPGWYAPANTTPVIDLKPLRKTLKISKDLEATLRTPRILTSAQDEALRELLDAVDAPVIAHVDAVTKAPMLDATLPPLERAASYLAGGFVEEAITAIAEAWRASHASQLADLIDRAARLTPAYHRPLIDKRISYDDDKPASRIWDAAFEADPDAAMPQLLLNLGVGGSTAIHARARKLAELPLDPRFGARLVELLSSRPTWDARSWWPPIHDIWLRSLDARTYPSLLELESQEDPDHPPQGRAKQVYEMARGAAPKLPAADKPLVAAIEAELERREEPYRTECSLVDQIAANPDDDGPYLVYADWLIEHGRPLGEYITLTVQQRSSPLSPAQARRLALLVEVPYLRAAFDDMPATRKRSNPRGIDTTLSVYWSTRPRSWHVAAMSPLVRALRRIELVGSPLQGREEAIAEFVQAAPALERISNLSTGAANKLAKRLEGWTVKKNTVTSKDEYEGTVHHIELVRGR